MTAAKRSASPVMDAQSSASSTDSDSSDTSDSASNASDDSGATSVSTTPTVAAAGESVTAGDQKAGQSVMVDSVSAEHLTWVAVRDSKGWVLGAARVEAGAHNDLSVPLLRATAAGGDYEVVLYVDDGDKLFDLHKDTLITNTNDGAVSATFVAK